MLYKETVEAGTLDLIRQLMADPTLHDFLWLVAQPSPCK